MSRRDSGDRADRLISLCAIVAAVAAVLVSAYAAYMQREQLKISVWPHLSQSNRMTPGQPYVRTVRNGGMGPALVRSFQVSVDGQPHRSWSAVVKAATGLPAPPALVYSSLGPGTVVLPGAEVELLRLPAGPEAAAFWTVMQDDRVSLRICYCSLRGDCWVGDSGEPDPRPVRRCQPDPGREFAD
ncbi:hypothetical protein [Longimicrobium terrae]|uniref:Uncharacterized protein n=1 Tax=Longimicrobium terrae TaxID=1639882 RepID=A0A841H1G4_9BACT|nr:hypothetical protein [Longimicrobium terrae]MBB4637410.1 hypothetical protein [Longimicrobium terrae]MBB6071808.1 hypothetical protein [Longimicrobium terrae]NNC28567.1 hypothetical protein [Longimicrobium terrae]